MGFFSYYYLINCYRLCFRDFILYDHLSWRQDFRVLDSDKLFKIMRCGTDRAFGNGVPVHRLVRVYRVFNIHDSRDDSFIRKNQKNTCNGRDFAACDNVFLLKRPDAFPKIYDIKIFNGIEIFK